MKRFLYIFFLLIFIIESPGQDIDVPIDVQVTILHKVIALERNLNKKIENLSELRIGIVYQNKFRSSLNAYTEVLNQFKKNNKYKGKNISVKPINAENASDINAFLANNRIDILIVTPLRAIEISDISAMTKRNKILSFALAPSYVSDGISVGVALSESKAQILINLKSAKEEGADFSSHLLKIVKIIN